MIHLFRHADAGRRSEWVGPDEERPLSERGWLQAKQAAGHMAGNGVGRILSSPYLRCIQSVEPLAEMTGLTIEVEPVLAEETPVELVDGLLAVIDHGVVLCSHGDVISELIGRASARGADLDGGLLWQKGSIWNLETSAAGRIVAGSYVPPSLNGS
jgi:phosphohistidine phosphatase SixA